MIAAIIISLIIIVPIAIYCNNKRNELISEGKIVNRDLKFTQMAEIFTINKLSDYSLVNDGLMNFDYDDIKCNLDGSKSKQSFKFKGSDWSAKLWLLDDREAETVYRFEFENWSERNGIPYSALPMNKLLTAVEKMFLAIDSNAKVASEKIEFKTKHSFL